MFVENLLSYDQIYQSCEEALSRYAQEGESSSFLQEQKVSFVANTPFKESFELHLYRKQLTFRVTGVFSSENLNESSLLIQRVLFLAEKHRLVNADQTSLGKTSQGSRSKKRRLKKSVSPPGSPQGAKTIKHLFNPEISTEKRRKNLGKAFSEHGKEDCDISVIFKESIFFPLSFKSFMAQSQGTRDYMEDGGFCVENTKGLLAGTFDGHCDQGKVATYASMYFQEHFFKKLEERPGQISDIISDIFKECIDCIHNEVKTFMGGTTAVVCYIDKSTNFVYTSTLGDSQNFVFRKQRDKIEWFPVSCVRDWSCKNDAERAVEGLKLYTSRYSNTKFIDYPKYLDIQNWINEKDPKKLRFPPLATGINVSRTIGDYNNINQWPSIEILSHKPKITEFLLHSYDLLVIGTDGIWDYVKIKRLIKHVLMPNWGSENMAQLIVDHAIGQPVKGKKYTRDNATAICIYSEPIKNT